MDAWDGMPGGVAVLGLATALDSGPVGVLLSSTAAGVCTVGVVLSCDASCCGLTSVADVLPGVILRAELASSLPDEVADVVRVSAVPMRLPGPLLGEG